MSICLLLFSLGFSAAELSCLVALQVNVAEYKVQTAQALDLKASCPLQPVML